MAFTLLAHTAAASTDELAVTTSALDTTGATLLVTAVSQYLYTRTFTLSDSKSNTWTMLTQVASSDDPTLTCHYCQNPTVGASHTFTATSDTSRVYPGLAVASFSGAVLTGVLDGENGFSDPGPAYAATIQPGSLTPAGNNELFITAIAQTTYSTTFSIGSSFTITDTMTLGVANIGVAMAYKIQTTGGAENPVWTTGVATYKPQAKLITFKSLAVVTPGGGKRRLMGMGA